MREPTRSEVMPVPALVERARAYFRSEATRGYEFRVGRLKALRAAMQSHEQRFLDAFKSDLNKSVTEGWIGELGIVHDEINHTLKHLHSWMKPERRGLPLILWPGSGARYPEPLGTTLIIAPWNYPFQLAISPLVGAIAAGCNAVIKPSELSPATAGVLESMCHEAFGEDGYVSVVQGGVEASTALLAERWDLIFFTGSTQVGQIVAQAAAKHLTPCVLELGGKSPCIVDEDTDLTTTAHRVAWGKTYNAGQSCIAPDYALVHRNVKDAFINALGTTFREFFGPDASKSPELGRIVSARHFSRLQTLMQGGRVVFGGQTDEATRFVAPTVLTDVNLSHPLMQEEIFGPLLPVIEVPDLASAIRFVNERPKPLALYIFTRDEAKSEEVLKRVSAGGALVNDTMFHIGAPELPFGGVGPSGTGAYHGKASFDAFTHYKSVLKRSFALDPSARYPPYKVSLATLKRLIG